MTKADIFALALTVVSASGAEPLPTNGDKWHEIRQGKLPSIPQVLSPDFLSLLKVTVNFFFYPFSFWLLVYVRMGVVLSRVAFCPFSAVVCMLIIIFSKFIGLFYIKALKKMFGMFLFHFLS